jgi:hypothetical protein
MEYARLIIISSSVGDFLQSWLFHESEFIWREGTNLNLIKNVWIALETCFFIPNKDIG